MAGEAGHVIVKADETLACGCWGRGCLEQYASATAVIRMAKERLGNAALSAAHEMVLLARAGNKQARSIFDTAGQALAIAIPGFSDTLSIPLYSLGGAVRLRVDEPEVLELARIGARKTYILKAKLGSAVGLRGACVLALESFNPSPQQ